MDWKTRTGEFGIANVIWKLGGVPEDMSASGGFGHEFNADLLVGSTSSRTSSPPRSGRPRLVRGSVWDRSDEVSSSRFRILKLGNQAAS
jgi:hypothetical protein